jgi:hypothetical protein
MTSFCPPLTPARVGSGAALLALITSLLGGCEGGQSGAEVATDGPDDPVGPECQTDDICLERALTELDGLASSRQTSYQVANAACQSYGVQLADRQVSGLACRCTLAGASSLQQTYMLGPTGVGCSVVGRGGECLWSDEDATGCESPIGQSCDAPCAELAQRLSADEARSFRAELVHAGCEQGTCRNVLAIDGQCYTSFPYHQSFPDAAQAGFLSKSYDCALGAEAILQADAVAWMPLKFSGRPSESSSYLQPGSIATVRLTVAQDYWGTARSPLGFGVSAQFYERVAADVRYGELLYPLDPVELLNGCRVWRQSPNGAAPGRRLLSVDRAVMSDCNQEFALQELHPSSDSYSYQLDLAAAGVTPRFRARDYSFSASGGSFGGSVSVAFLSLPEVISSPELERNSHLERGQLALTWEGQGANTLQLSFDIKPQLGDDSDAYHIECRPPDAAGAFTMPAAVLEVVPDGFVTATFRRTWTMEGSVRGVAEAVTNHHFVLGPTCDGSALMAACQRSANTIRARYQECSDLEPPPLEQLCPDYLATTCGSCPEYFDCLAASTTCGSDGLSTRAGCRCPE